MDRRIEKTLSPNDAGETGSHQAGILVPKDPDILGYFPSLDESTKNPRVQLSFIDDERRRWEFVFIYYNNVYFGGTRDEYRLTRMTQYFRSYALSSGDRVEFWKDANAARRVSFQRKADVSPTEQGVLRLTSGWRVINI